MVKGLVSILESDLKKSDRRALATLYLYWLENGKKNVFDLPLFVDDNGKGVMSVESFKRVFYAFCVRSNVSYDCEIKSGTDGNESSYNVVRLSCNTKCTPTNNTLWQGAFEEPKKTDIKRESSKKTAEKSKAKKEATEKKEAENNKEWNKRACQNLVDVFMKYGIRLSNEQLNKLESDIIKVLETTI